jgi:hypothetical protein
MSTASYTKRFLSAVVPSLALLGSSVFAIETEGLPEVSIERGKLSSAAMRGVDRIFQAESGFPGYGEARAIAASLFSQSGAKVDVNLEFNKSGSALLFVQREDPTAFFRIDTKTGDFSFNKGMAEYTAPKHTPGLPGKDEAVDLAVSYLERLDLMPKDKDQLVVEAVGGLAMGSQAENGTVENFEKLTSVHFGRQIDGIDVGGPGSKIVVHLGRNGELVGLHRRWSELRETSSISGKSFLEAQEVTERAVKHLQTEWHKAAKISSAAPEPGYFDDGKGHIEPVYFLQAEVQHDPQIDKLANPDDEPKRYLGVISALHYSGADLRQLQPATKGPGQGDAFGETAKRDRSDD